MTKEEFVARLFSLCQEAESGVMSSLKTPPVRSPNAGRLRRSKWFRSLSIRDQDSVREIVRYAAEFAVFLVLSELDGIGGVAANPEDGMYKLYYTEEGVDTLITDPRQEPLHDLFQSLRDFS